jgi:ABC-type glycerol-3-phosphate transport system substrate-binding protein
MVITWASRYLQGQPGDSAVAPLPTPDEKDFTLATGWVWALASPHLEDQKLAAELAAYLSESAFLGDWTEATGYLPPRPSALEGWRDAGLRSFARQVSTSASLVPSADVLPGLATPLVAAVAEMLKLQSDPASSAQEAVNSFLNP